MSNVTRTITTGSAAIAALLAVALPGRAAETLPPIPGPYQAPMAQPAPMPAPAVGRINRRTPPLPYWMQAPARVARPKVAANADRLGTGQQASTDAQARTQMQTGMNFAASAQMQGRAASRNMGRGNGFGGWPYGQAPAPGYFPGYPLQGQAGSAPQQPKRPVQTTMPAPGTARTQPYPYGYPPRQWAPSGFAGGWPGMPFPGWGYGAPAYGPAWQARVPMNGTPRN